MKDRTMDTAYEHSHKVTVSVVGSYSHGPRQRVEVSIAGDGSLDHMIEVFRAALVAAGFSAETAAQLDEVVQ